MLIRFSSENFKSFAKRQTLNLVANSKLCEHSDRLLNVNEKLKLLRNAVIYGANASGKSNFITAIDYSKYTAIKGISADVQKFNCRLSEESIKKDILFEYEFSKGKNIYRYAFKINANENLITYECLDILNERKYENIFERDRKRNVIKGKYLDKLEIDERVRFDIYIEDFANSAESNITFLSYINNSKTIKENSILFVFNEVFDWFENDLNTSFFRDENISEFRTEKLDELNNILSSFDTGITELIIENVDLEDLPNSILKDVKDRIIPLIRKEELLKSIVIKGRNNRAFYEISMEENIPKIQTIKFKHGKCESLFDLMEESDGTKRLIELLEILLSANDNSVFIIDELERSLHPMLTIRFLELFNELFKEKNVQLIFTSHESQIMNLDLFRRDEVWFVERNRDNISSLYSLDKFKERNDKKISKAYLEGRYGALPIFKNFNFKEEY